MISLDLKLAYKRTKHYRSDRSFIDHPLLLDLIEFGLDEWISKIQKKIDNNEYNPKEAIPCFIPKPNHMLRKGVVLDLRDEIVFTAILGYFFDKIWESVKWSQGNQDMAYQLCDPSNDVEWTINRLTNWKEWTQMSLNMLDKGSRYVLFTDIINFYDNIDLKILYSQLKELNLDPVFVDLIIKCLHRWSVPNGKGIPQGYTSSDILAKIYMNSIDRYLYDKGVLHLRYVDDIRIFCDSKYDARSALNDLIIRLAQKGLALNGSKTEIFPAEEAKRKIEGVSPVINAIHKDLLSELQMGEYVKDFEIEEEFSKNPEKVNPSLFEIVFIERFSSVTNPQFDKTLFHYLLTRLGKINSNIAVRYCIDTIPVRPEEMEYILKYLSKMELSNSELEQILKFMESKDAIYDYQLYQLVQWFFQLNKLPNTLLALCRVWAHDKNREPWLRTYSLMVLAKAGHTSDLESIQGLYSSASTDYQKAEVICCLERMEKTRRNSFYGQVKDDNDLVRRAVEVAKQRM